MKIAHSSKPSVSGFTLIELMIAVALLGILLTLAMPSFSDMIRRMRIESAANSLSVALATARSEAVKRGRNISVCKSANSSACTTSGDWSTGWVIYATAGTPIKAFDAPSGG
ncbi:GspH/FimT family pseudopilin [Dechloromonas sp. A34]|uniref:GspH/FimT family pseudopilin n=1 Tax=Dechloromonas sp. A34 TaxID=447588 RepID=UPI0022494394|nr:GspH/FimT family pseudopilin [Dechloromonas sp. A34]